MNIERRPSNGPPSPRQHHAATAAEAAAERDQIAAWEHWKRETITRRPDGTIIACREEGARGFERARTRASVAVAYTAESQPHPARYVPGGTEPRRLAGASCAVRPDLRRAVRAALLVFAGTLVLYGNRYGWDAESLFRVLLYGPLKAQHSLAAVAALAAAALSLRRQGCPGLRRAPWVAAGLILTAVLPAIPLSYEIRGFLPAFRAIATVAVSAWAFFPVGHAARRGLSRLREFMNNTHHDPHRGYEHGHGSPPSNHAATPLALLQGVTDEALRIVTAPIQRLCNPPPFHPPQHDSRSDGLRRHAAPAIEVTANPTLTNVQARPVRPLPGIRSDDGARRLLASDPALRRSLARGRRDR